MGGGRSRDLRGDGAEGPKEWERVGAQHQYQLQQGKASPLSVAVFSRILGQRQPRRMGMGWRWGVRVLRLASARNLEIGWIGSRGFNGRVWGEVTDENER